MADDSKDKRNEQEEREQQRQRLTRYAISYLLFSLVALWLFQDVFMGSVSSPVTEITYSEFKKKVATGQIVNALVGQNDVTGEMKNPQADATPEVVRFETPLLQGSDPDLVADLQAANVSFTFGRPPSALSSFLLAYGLPLLLLGVFWYVIFRGSSARGGMHNILGVGRSKATEVKGEDIGITFKDVGGVDEAITELQEIIDFLKTPEQFARLGGRIPKGVLLVGPPGTGKTLLAKATAGEAGVPFFQSSGSEFVEMFVGVGAARVRDLFVQARKSAPAIVFIDEIDAIGQSRGGMGGISSNEEREQTLNQLLAEIDGFKTDVSRPVIIMAATNRPEILDPALLRAGRFDRQVAVGNPDLTGRLQILRIHSRKVTLAPDFDLDRAARITPGFSGADLANVMNEAALLAARRKADAVTMADFEAAIERVVAGLERKSRVLNESERKAVAHHESGHALVAALVPHGDPVAKISIVPRGVGALGYTLQMPTEDRYLLTREELEDRIAVLLGGRAAEMVVFGTISTGASDDINRATELARRMITEFGMSEALGPVRYAGQQMQYLSRTLQDNTDISPATRETIDREVQKLVSGQLERAQQLLMGHRGALDALAAELLEHETLDGAAVTTALAAEKTPA